MRLMLSHMLKCICNLHSAAFMLTHFQKSDLWMPQRLRAPAGGRGAVRDIFRG